MKTYNFQLALLLISSIFYQVSFGQSKYANLFYNSGAVVMVQGTALLHVQGDVINKNGSDFINNGVLQVEGDFTNESNTAKYRTDNAGSGSSTREQTVRFIGGPEVCGTASSATHEQKIIGTINDATNAYFQNIVIDKANTVTPSYVTISTGDVLCKGSLVWGTGTTASAAGGYNPSWITAGQRLGNVTGRTNATRASGGHGVLKLFDAGNNNEFYLSNGDYRALAGYLTPVSSTANVTANNKWIEGKGAVADAKGFARQVNTTSQVYTFPIATSTNTYNPVDMYFSSIASGSDKVTSKFTDEVTVKAGFTKTLDCNKSDFTSSSPSISSCTAGTYTIGYGGATQTIDNSGYNVYRKGNCNSNGSWYIASAWITNHGYWSFSGGSNTYEINTYPNSYTALTGGNGAMRVLKTDQVAFNAEPTGNWTSEISAPTGGLVSNDDLVTYTTGNSGKKFGGTCGGVASIPVPGTANTYASTIGIPGGRYTGYSHFAIAGAPNTTAGNALPVELTYLRADPIENTYIKVSWETATEINNKGFEIKRSTDGVQFETIGWEAGNGNSSTRINYAYDDRNVIPNQTYYYKLNQIDYDGKSEETYIVAAKITDGSSFVIGDFVPNPTQADARLTITTTESQPIEVKLFNILGAEVIHKNYQLIAGSNQLSFESSGLADATYTAIIKAGNNIYSKKLVVSRF